MIVLDAVAAALGLAAAGLLTAADMTRRAKRRLQGQKSPP